MRKPALWALLLAFAALFFGWETWQAWRGAPGAQDATAPKAQGIWQPGAVSPDPTPPADMSAAGSAVAGRPLFRQDRQPFREASAGVPARNYEAELSRYTLLGVLSFGDEMKGMVVSKSGGKTDRWELKAGESFPGFTVKEVRTDSLLVTADEREFQLPLYAGSPNATGGALRTEVLKAAPAAASAPTAPARPAPKGGQAATAAPSPSPARPQTPVPTAPPQRDGRPRYVPGRR
ncbi:MAG: hypothetical protein ACXWWY_12480 [Candidatus Deferrimicrobiaceae bacterium]